MTERHSVLGRLLPQTVYFDMQRPAPIRQRPLFREQVLELLDRGGVRGPLAMDKIDSGVEHASLRGHEPFQLKQGNELLSISLREAKELVIGQRQGLLSQVGRHRKPVHENGQKTVDIAHHLRMHIHR
jgi:hypothetical protein